MPETPLSVDRRFRGPPESANGGYICGLIASRSTEPVTVRLRAPPPLDVELAVNRLPNAGVEIRHEDVLVADSRPAEFDLLRMDLPAYVSIEDSTAASKRYVGFAGHRFPTCFVCGTERRPGDGLRIFAGAVEGRHVVAAPWVPDESLDRGDACVRPEFMWAALDCPGYFAIASDGRMMLLGQFTALIQRLATVGEPCTVAGWSLGSNGRRHEAGTVLWGSQGELCGVARATWIEPR